MANQVIKMLEIIVLPKDPQGKDDEGVRINNRVRMDIKSNNP